MQHFERGLPLLRQIQLSNFWLRHGWNIHLPFMIGIVDVTTCITNNETTNFVSAQVDALQHVDYFSLEIENWKQLDYEASKTTLQHLHQTNDWHPRTPEDFVSADLYNIDKLF